MPTTLLEEHVSELLMRRLLQDRAQAQRQVLAVLKSDGALVFDAPEAAGAWAARIEGKLLPGESKGAPQTVIFYLGIDGDGGGASRLSVAAERPTFTPGAGTHVTGEVDGVGNGGV